METGTTVYINWYDFEKKAEHLCKGVVEDNSLWADTQWRDHICVSFRPPSLKDAICHHFLPEKVSTDINSVPHDDCTLVCAKRMPTGGSRPSASDAWQAVQQFKQDHWDFQHGHLSIEAIDEYYDLWRAAIAAKRGYVHIYEVALYPASPTTAASSSLAHGGLPVVSTPIPDSSGSVPDSSPSVLATTPVASAAGTPSRKQLRSTGRIQYKDTIQTSIFD